MPRRGDAISWWVKLPYTVFVAVLLPVYVREYGWGNLLWFSDVALLLTLVALWWESRLIISMMALSAIGPELAWNADYFARLLFSDHLTGQTEYMFEPHRSLFVRGLSLFHIVLPVLLVWAVHRLRYDRRALFFQVLLCWAVLLATYLWTDPRDNINYVFSPSPAETTWLTQKVWLAVLMIAFPVLVYLPTHLILWRVMGIPGPPASGAGDDEKRMPHDRTEAGRAGRHRLGWPSRIFLLLEAVLVMLVLPIGCTTCVHPPETVADPVTVYLLDHGRTPALVLPDGQGGMIRYTYGDWDYYALRRTSFLDGARALLWPTQAALGRMQMAGPPTPENVHRQVKVGIEQLYAVEVERAAVDQLRERLERMYLMNLSSRVQTPSVDLAFVHHPRPYTYFHNSNHRVAAWLEALGCDIRGPAYYSRWCVE